MLKQINKLANLESHRNSAIVYGKTNIAVLDGSMSIEVAAELIISTFGDRANVLARWQCWKK